MKEETIQTSDFDVIRNAVSACEPNALVVFDVDEVLLTASDQVLQYKQYFNEAFSAQVVKSPLTDPEIFNLMSILFMERKAKLVEPGFVDLYRFNLKVPV